MAGMADGPFVRCAMSVVTIRLGSLPGQLGALTAMALTEDGQLTLAAENSILLAH